MVPYLICRLVVPEVGPLKNFDLEDAGISSSKWQECPREGHCIKRNGTGIYLKICYNKRME